MSYGSLARKGSSEIGMQYGKRITDALKILEASKATSSFSAVAAELQRLHF